MRARPSTMRKPQLASLPESPLILSECLCAVGKTRRPNIVEIEVADRDRRGDTATGLTWGEAPLPLIPSRRLMTCGTRRERVFVYSTQRAIASGPTTMTNSPTGRGERSRCTLVGVTIAMHLWMMTFGNNFDFVSYQIVAEMRTGGGNIDVNTQRYYRGPPW